MKRRTPRSTRTDTLFPYTTGCRSDGGGYRRDHLRALAQRVEVAEGEVRIVGSKSRLLQTLVAGTGVNAVPTQGLKWRSGRDSNPRYGFAVYSLSKRAPSTTRQPLRLAGTRRQIGRPPGRERG